MPSQTLLPSDLARRVQLEYQKSIALSKRSLGGYLDRVVIDSLPEPRRWGLVREPWQDDVVGPMVPAIEFMAGVRPTRPDGPKWFWRTLPKGHDKTTLQGRLLNYCLGFGRRKTGLNLYAVAADRDQAALILDAMRAEASLNPWLKSRILFTHKTAVGAGGKLSILAADAASSQGLRPDFVICDELTCWRNEKLYTAIVSGVSKKRHAVLVVITNAGVRLSWQHDCLEEARLQPAKWDVYESPVGVQLASWMDPSDVAVVRKQMPPGEAARLYDNRWVDAGEEDGFVRRADAEACEKLGQEMNLAYRPRGERGVRYYAAIDYAPKKDRTAMCVLHADKTTRRVVVDRLDVLQGSPDQPVQVAQVEAWLEGVRADFADVQFTIDSYQMESTIQKYEGRVNLERFEFRGGKRNYEMAECLRTHLVNRQVAWYGSCGQVTVAGRPHTLTDELAELVVRRMSYGYRFDHEASKHDDRAVAVGMALLTCVRDRGADFVAPPKKEGPPEPPPRPEVPVMSHAERQGLFGMGGGRR